VVSPAAGQVTGWQAFGASARGALHVKSGLPNQDCHLHAAASDRGEGLILAVADGHGDQRCVRADVGARLAVAAAAGCARQLVADSDLIAGPATGDVARRLVPSIVDTWRAAVRDHLAAEPWRRDERDQVDRHGDDHLGYGCTLLVAVVTGWSLLLVQIGDGDILLVNDDGEPSRPIRQHVDFVGGETLSLAARDASSYAAAVTMGLDDSIRLVLLATDGYANSFETADWEQPIGADYVRLLAQEGAGWIADRLPEWVEASAAAAGDDVTVLVAARI
jgi:hypothetical protein